MRQSKWQLFINELRMRFTDPFKFPEFIFYFFTVIVLVGVSGVVITILVERHMEQEDPNHKFSHIHIILSIASYFIALLTSSAVDLILSSRSHSLTREKQGLLRRSLIMLGLGSIFIGLFLMSLSLLAAEICIWGYMFAIGGLVFSWYIWWITNSVNPNLTDNSEDAFSVLGSAPPTTPEGTFELSGNLNGIKI